jgi:hypothetical protein
MSLECENNTSEPCIFTSYSDENVKKVTKNRDVLKLVEENKNEVTMDENSNLHYARQSLKWSHLVWRNIFAFIILHYLALWGYKRIITDENLQIKTVGMAYLSGTFSLIGEFE